MVRTNGNGGTASIEEVAGRSFDYIIVGGGTAGLTLAARLSEDPTKTVLVLEAGEANIDHPEILRTVPYARGICTNMAIAWQMKTTKQKFNYDRVNDWHRGKCLGGSSAINNMVYNKPPARDIDDFERLGNPGWNWKNFQRFVSRTEGFVEPPEEIREPRNLNYDDWQIGREGPLPVSLPPTIAEGEWLVQQTYVNAGVPIAHLPLNGDPEGVFFAPNSYDPRTHTRSYSTTAFYLPNKNRKNLTVLASASARRVLTTPAPDGELVASSVEFTHSGMVCTVTASKEVILCAGTLRSPQILEQSGIGRADVLKKASIPLKLDLPGVGENVQEHVFICLIFELKDDAPLETFDLFREPEALAKQLELRKKGQGIFTTGCTSFGFLPLDKVTSKAQEIYENIGNMVEEVRNDPNAPPGLLEQYEINMERFKPGSGSPGCEFINVPGAAPSPKPTVPGKKYFSVSIAMNHLFSRGTIHSLTNNPNDDTEIDPHYFEKSVDLDIYVETIKYARNIAKIAPFKDMIVTEHTPGPECDTDEKLREWAGKMFCTTWHTSSSCSMLPRNKGGVVDPNLKVYGTTNIRVVDLSVIPLQFASHTQSVVYGLAEQAADTIKGKFTA